MIMKVSQVNGTIGIAKLGSSPASVAVSRWSAGSKSRTKSITVRASRSRPCTNKVTVTIATSDAGTALVSFGNK